MKSHVSLEQKCCPICGKTFDNGTILLDRRLKQSLEHHTVTGYDICEACIKPGFLSIVICDESKSTFNSKGRLTPEGAYKTGEVIYIKKEVASQIFNCDINFPFLYGGQDLADKLKSIMEG
jgi:hypothetical protein